MVQTRSQTGTPAKQTTSQKKNPAKKRAKAEDEVAKPKSSGNTPKKLKSSKSPTEKPSEEAKPTKSETSNPRPLDSTISKPLSSQETIPLSDLSLPESPNPTSSTALAHIFNALLSSTRISHSIASKTLSCLVTAGYCDLPTLRTSTWEDRTRVLTEGGYTHYREKTATALGDMAALIEEKYGGDAARLIVGDDETEAVLQGEEKREKVAARLKEIKGLGPLGIGLFMETAQAWWNPLAPFVAERDLKALREAGVVESVEEIYEMVGRDARVMARLCAAVAKARLEGRMGEFR